MQNKTAGCIGSDSYLSCISSSVKVKMSFGLQDKIRQSFSIVDAVIFWLFLSCCIPAIIGEPMLIQSLIDGFKNYIVRPDDLEKMMEI